MFHFASKGGYYLSAAFIQERPLIEHIRLPENHYTVEIGQIMAVQRHKQCNYNSFQHLQQYSDH